MKLLPSRRVPCTPYNHAPCHFMQITKGIHSCKPAALNRQIAGAGRAGRWGPGGGKEKCDGDGVGGGGWGGWQEKGAR